MNLAAQNSIVRVAKSLERKQAKEKNHEVKICKKQKHFFVFYYNFFKIKVSGNPCHKKSQGCQIPNKKKL